MAGKLDHLKIKTAPECFSTWARNFNQQVDLIGSMEGGPGIDVQVTHSPRAQFLQPLASSHAPKEQPRGKIKFTVRPSALAGLGVGSGGGSNGNATLAVGINGSLVGVSSETHPNAGIFPSRLEVQNVNFRWYSDGSNSVTDLLAGVGKSSMAATGFRTDDNTNFAFVGPNSATWTAPNSIIASIKPDAMKVSSVNGAFTQMTAGTLGVTDGTNGLVVAGTTLQFAIPNSNGFMFQVNATGFTLSNGTNFNNVMSIPWSLLTRNLTIKTIQVCNANVNQSMLVIGSDPF